MRRAAKALLILLPWGLLVVLIWDDLRRIDLFAIDAATEAHGIARQNFFAELAYDGCVPREAVIAEAEARDWGWQQMEELAWCHSPTDLSNWVRIQVSPALPFSTDDENAALIGFDAQGCMREWHLATGPGSTCPED